MRHREDYYDDRYPEHGYDERPMRRQEQPSPWRRRIVGSIVAAAVLQVTYDAAAVRNEEAVFFNYKDPANLLDYPVADAKFLYENGSMVLKAFTSIAGPAIDAVS